MASTTAAATAPPRPLHLRSPSSLSRSSLAIAISAPALLPRSFPSLRTCVAPLSRRRHLSVRCNSGLSPELKSTLDKVVTSNKVVLFMKGTKDFPQCGFSHTVVQILKSLNVPFETLDVLSNEALRQGLKEYSSWPTFPQLYIDGEFFGGCDITVDAYKSGELQELLEKTMLS
ncbi:Monothiol glutaredoxin-S7 [Rhynchospora pubera]|uniref:Monothiol glutaredoxin-S7 n=1 Tax=Rhynchospora pubera TaxID=906938 RepID=A0AAV8CMY2_9POAL|nr:Monothiol glutaredoxin-S7 [Rhynchospora pubera]